MPAPLNELVFAVQCRPNAKVLDARGHLAMAIARHFDFQSWQISESRVDVYDAEKLAESKVRVFVDYRSFGITVSDASSHGDLTRPARKLLELLMKRPEFTNTIYVNRTGVRCKFSTSGSGLSLDNLVNKITNQFFSLTTKGQSAVGGSAKLIGVAGLLTFADDLGDFNSNTAAMDREALRRHFPHRKKDDLPETSLFYDVDYFEKPEKDVKGSAIVKFIEDCAKRGWERHTRIRRTILG